MKTYYHIKPSRLSGNLSVPSSKSQTLRAIIFASLAEGKSVIRHYLHSPDTVAMIEACIQLGAKIESTREQLNIAGVSGQPLTPCNVIDAGNSGQVLRFIAAIAALNSKGYTVLTGDRSIRENRPTEPLLSALRQLSVFAETSHPHQGAPLIVKGPLKGGKVRMQGQDSQPVSAMIIAAAFADEPIEIQVAEAGEKPWVDLTLSWLNRLVIPYEREGHEVYRLKGKANYCGFSYRVPADFSSAAFPVVAAILSEREFVIDGLDWAEPQGDKHFFYILKTLGANLYIDEQNQQIRIFSNHALQGRKIDINDCIDCVAILSVLACFIEGETQISGASIARKKECNRLSVMVKELSKMGARIQETEDGLRIFGSRLKGAELDSHADHRVAMALSIAAMFSEGASRIKNIDCIKKSYPSFLSVFQGAGANIEPMHD